jgi:hypothetical protein
MKLVEAFFRDLDARWQPIGATRIRLPIIGSTALFLQTDYDRGTNDSDVLSTPSLPSAVEKQLLALAGRGSPLFTRHRLYLDVVGNGIPFLAQTPVWNRLVQLSAALQHFDVEVLDVVDVVVSKLKRFSANDQSDIAAMIDRDLVPHEKLITRFAAAVDIYKDGADGPSIRRYVRNLHRIEENEYGVEPTLIELPDWLDD